MALPSEPVLNHELTVETGRPVVMLDVVPVAVGERLRVSFRATSGKWRQGIWLGVDGELDIGGTRADQVEIWTDTAPASFDVVVLKTADGLLRLHNIWDSGRGRHRESQGATSGMLKDAKEGSTVYRANDIGSQPKFDKLVFELRRVRPRD